MSRHRHHKPQHDMTAVRGRDTRRRELADKLATANGISVDDFRIDLASWSALALDLAKTEMLRGRIGDVAPWQRLADQMNGLVPKADVLTVKFVDHTDLCLQCKKVLTPEDRQPVAKPVVSSSDPAIVDKPAVPANEPAASTSPNVIPLKPAQAPPTLGEMVAAVNAGPTGPTISLPPGQDSLGGYGRFDNNG